MKPRTLSNVKLKDVKIMVFPESGSREGDEGVNPFKPSRRLLRSPTATGRKESYDGGDSEKSVTPMEKTDREKTYLARRAVEMNSPAGYDKRIQGGNEIGDSAVQDSEDPYSDNEKDARYYLTG